MSQRDVCLAALLAAYTLCDGCASSKSGPSLEFTEVPDAGPGGGGKTENIAGRAIGAKPGQRIVLFAKSGTWWVQPFSNKPFTSIQPDLTWKSTTHLGTEYAALLVAPGYVPRKTVDNLPSKGGNILAVAKVTGRPTAESIVPPKTIEFSGYQWDVRQIPSDSGGVMHINRAENAWTDAKGWLHMRIARVSGTWTCAEIAMMRSLGYGSYSFVVREMPELEPGDVLGMFTWDEAEAGQSHREIDIELSQWGDPATKNAQFTIQPYYVPANVFRFVNRGGPMTHSFRWEPGRASFKTFEGPAGNPSRVIAEHSFTSGIPSPADEKIHLNLYIYGKSRTQQQNGVEVVLEKFEYLP